MARIVAPIAGAAIGFVYGGPQGARIGWMIGSVVGSIVDPMQIEGPALGDQPVQTSRDGVPRPIIFGTASCTGNLIWCSPPKFTKKKTKQPKGGPVTVENRVLYSYAVRICDARKNPIEGIVRVWCDEKLVYDVSPTSTMVAESNKWKSNVKFYLGTEDQMPDPTIELYKGVGNVPFYRGTAYMVITDHDTTDIGGRRPSYRFEVAAAGTSEPPETVLMDDYDGNGVSGGTVATWLSIYTDYYEARPFMSFLAQALDSGMDPSAPSKIRVFCESRLVFDSGWIGETSFQTDLDLALLNCNRVRYQGFSGDPTVIDITDPDQIRAIILDIDNGAIQGPADVTGYYIPTSTAGGLRVEYIRPYSATNAVNSSFRVYEPVVPEDYIAYRSQPGVLRGVSGTTYFTEFADSVSIITPGSTTVRAIIEKIASYVGMGPTDLEIDEVGDEQVDGYTCAGLFACAQALKPLQLTHFFDFVSFDQKTWAVKRGKDSSLTLYDDECLVGDSPERRDYDIEYPRKLHLSYQSAEIGYAVTKETAERSSQDVQVVGELSVNTSECMSSEKAVRISDVLMKAAWVDVKGEVRRRVSRRFSKVVPTAIITLVTSETVMRLRVHEINRVDGVNELVMRHDRQSAYTSILEGTTRPLPTPPPSTIAGPTYFGSFNVPPRTESEDKLGFLIGGAGVLAGWSGFQHQLSEDGEVTFNAEGNYSSEATIGYLVSDVPGMPSQFEDETSEIVIQLYAGEFESITDDQFYNYGNAIVISRLDGTSEYLQFKTAELIGTNQWKLTNLMRGRRGTSSAGHSAGAAAALVSDLIFVDVESSAIGKTLVSRPVSFDESSEDTATYPIVMNPVRSQQELAPVDLSLSLNGSDLTIDWVARTFLGTEMNPIISSNFIGWRIVISDGVTQIERTEAPTIPTSITLDVSSLSGATTVQVAGINRTTAVGLIAQESITI